MKERPIIFKAEMVKAILDGSKTQTRRIIKPQPYFDGSWMRWDGNKPKAKIATGALASGDKENFNEFLASFGKCPQGKAGDRLWVRENFSVTHVHEGYENPNVCDDFECDKAVVKYPDQTEATYELIVDSYMGIDDLSQARRAMKKKTSPSIHMPRWASRINLEINNIRIERLNDISEEDAKAEGARRVCVDIGVADIWSYKEGFKSLWQSINGQNSWEENPWVWVVEFKKIEENQEQLPKTVKSL